MAPFHAWLRLARERAALAGEPVGGDIPRVQVAVDHRPARLPFPSSDKMFVAMLLGLEDCMADVFFRAPVPGSMIVDIW